MDRNLIEGRATPEQGRVAPDEVRQPSCGELLRRYRSLAGLTQEELADRSGYSANYIGKLERDERKPPRPALDCLASTLQLGEAERSLLVAARDRRAGPGPPAGHRLIGREPAVGAIRRNLAGVGPPVLLFSGEPGIGKTRLLDEAAATAVQTGWRVVRGGCQRRAADIYAPLSGAVADALAGLSSRDREEAVRQAGQLDLLLPELALSASPPPTGGRTQTWSEAGIGPEQRRRLLFASVDRCLLAVAGQAGVLLVLDDLQWAGPDAFDLLSTVIPRSGARRARLIGAYRDSEPAADARLQEFVADLARDGLVQVVGLEPLGDADAEQLIAERIPPGDPSPMVVPAIVRRAGGVPFFLISYLENLRPGETDEPQLSLPWTVAQVIRQRVLALPETAQELLGVAAVVGPQISHSLLVHVTNRSDDEVVQALEAAVDARLLADDTKSGYHFAHDLVRETIESGLSPGRRRLLHRRIAEALEGDPRTSAEALAFHFTLGEADEKAILHLERAGDEAQQRVAHATAALFFQQAVDRLAQMERRQDAVRMYEKLGVALYRAARNDDAISALERARSGYLAAGHEEEAARVSIRLADVHYRRGSSHDDFAHSLSLRDGERVPDAGPMSDADLLQSEGLARLLFAHPSPPRMLTVGRTLRQTGQSRANERLEMIGRRIEGGGLIILGRVAEGAALLETAIPTDPVAANDERALELAGLLSGAYLAMGLVERSLAVSQRMVKAAETTGDDVVAAMHTVILAGGHYLLGDWPRGRQMLSGALARAAAVGPSALMVRTTQVVARCLTWEGRWAEARSYLEVSLEQARSMRIDAQERATLADLADIDLLEGAPDTALERVQPVLREEPTWEYVVSLFCTLAGAYLQLGDLEPARSHAQRAVAEARRTECWVHGVRALEISGSVDARTGNGEAARAAYDEALQRARSMPFPYAEARLLHASGLLDRQEGEAEAADAKLAAAFATFTRLGAAPDAEQVRQDTATQGGRSARRTGQSRSSGR